MSSVDKAIAKARKLLALAESDNPHEAAQAAQRAQELLDRHEISQAMLVAASSADAADDDEQIESSADTSTPIYQAGTIAAWRSILAQAIAAANQCRIYVSRTSGARGKQRFIQIVGRPSDVEKVRYLYQYLTGETDRLCDRDAKGRGRTWRNNYRLGVVDSIGIGLRAARAKVVEDMRAAAAAPGALVRIDNALATLNGRALAVDEFMAANLKLRSSSSRYRTNADARALGQSAGKEIYLSKARAALAR